MIRALLKKILRAAVAQPWEYMGEGAPNEWEFRQDPDTGVLAVWNPEKGYWVLFREVVTLAEVPMKEMDRYAGHWVRFVEELEGED